ncbi:MAG: hypothetical protein GTN76_08280, partial [Candidatus Aenigmarchaeota archaeon]|nr:hypothetical protein [Candidatus Aenigmarchaeota archaeon]
MQKGLGEVKTPRQRNRWVRKSVGEFQRAIELEPSHSDYHFHLGISYAYLGYPPLFYWKVIQDSFTRAAMLNPTHVRRLYAIGMYYLHEYDRLIKIGPNIETIGSFNHKDYAEFLKNNHTLYFRKLLDVNEEYLPKILRECYSVTRSY